GVAGGKHEHPEDLQLLRWNPETRKLHTIRLQRAATALAWSAVSNDLWMSNCGNGSVSRMHLATKKVTTPFEDVSNAPCPVAVGIDGAIWVGDWDASPPRVIRLSADGSGRQQVITLPPSKFGPGGVPSIAVGDGFIWVAVPDDHAVWRIDPPHPTRLKRIFLHYAPWGVAGGHQGAVWVTLHGSTTSVSK